ncbi:hypothetical protein MLD38_006312 [Melastoma candidum]|uniref:Uncharacterized protein n=1 Tax=Melastoma candidum TaxID=119954 RepID=A0ACB9RM42_9MYRT|nr:hypothetical protein MLD38_006312 [Melastoma candidum]
MELASEKKYKRLVKLGYKQSTTILEHISLDDSLELSQDSQLVSRENTTAANCSEDSLKVIGKAKKQTDEILKTSQHPQWSLGSLLGDHLLEIPRIRIWITGLSNRCWIDIQHVPEKNWFLQLGRVALLVAQVLIDLQKIVFGSHLCLGDKNDRGGTFCCIRCSNVSITRFLHLRRSHLQRERAFLESANNQSAKGCRA